MHGGRKFMHFETQMLPPDHLTLLSHSPKTNITGAGKGIRRPLHRPPNGRCDAGRLEPHTERRQDENVLPPCGRCRYLKNTGLPVSADL